MKKIMLVIMVVTVGFMLLPTKVSAMHIMEGYLPIENALLWFVLFIPFFILGLFHIKKLVEENPQNKVWLALAGAFIFILSALKIPSVTGSTSHPTGVGLGTAMFGPSVLSVLGTICLLFQALFLAHGGLTTLGANAFSMTVVGPYLGYFAYRLARRVNVDVKIAIFLCAFIADIATYLTTSIQLAIAFPDPVSGLYGSLLKFFGVFMMTQIPIAIIEGLLSVVLYNLVVTDKKQEFGALKQ